MRSLHWVTAQAVGQRLIAEYRTNLRDKRIFSVSTKRGLRWCCKYYSKVLKYKY